MSRTERAIRTRAIILKRRDFGEADRLLTIITPHHGKRDVIAKGARKPGSTKTGHVELFTCADMLIHRGRELDIATQAEMVTPYLPLREDLQRGAYASYVAELLDRFTTDGDDDLAGLFDLLADTLESLCTDDDPRLLIRFCEMRLLDDVGFRPELNECVFTHEPIAPEDQFFSNAEGGVVSPMAARHATALVNISLNALKLMRHLQRSRYAQVRELDVSPALHAEVERIMLGYITYLLERKLQSVDFIRRVRGG
jgi:DNA repair protein RecO (recombination protein O)